MKKSEDRIPDEVLKEIFPKKLEKHRTTNEFYNQLKQLILSGKLKRGQKLTYDGIAHKFNISKELVRNVISQLKKDGLIISKDKVGLFVA